MIKIIMIKNCFLLRTDSNVMWSDNTLSIVTTVRCASSVRWWMADKERRERIPVKATKQAWFKGTFREADDES